MDRITGTAVADLGGGKRGFQDEILSTGGGSQEGTVVTAQWLTSVQEEIMAVIEAAELEPDIGNWTQLRKAISTLIATAVGAVDLSGYTTDEALAAALANYVTEPALATIIANYVSNAALTAALANYLSLAGGTMTGPLQLSGNPVNALHAATKQYADNGIGSRATAGATCVYNSDIIEFGMVNQDGHGTYDAPENYVMVGIRTVAHDAHFYPRVRLLRNQ